MMRPVNDRVAKPWWRRRWFLVGGFWLGQALFIYFWLPVVGLSPASSRSLVDTVARSAGDADYALGMAVLIGAISVLQGTFLLPVRAPEAAKPGPAGRFLAFLLGGMAFGIMAVIVFSVGLLALNSVDIYLAFDWNYETWQSWAVFGAASACATGIMAACCPRGTPLWLSLVIAGLGAATLLAGVLLALIDAVELIRGEEFDGWVYPLAVLPAFALAWCVSTPLLVAFARKRPHDTALTRIASTMFIGTIVEAAAVIPIDVMVRRKTDCYCGEGTFWALTFSAGVGVLVLGPAILLMPLGRRRRRLLAGRCGVCGYDMAGTPDASRCPECGAGWRRRQS